MSKVKDHKGQGRGLSKRALVLSLAVYIVGLAVTMFGAGDEVIRYVGFALIGVGSIALATAIVNGVISISTGLRAAVILAVIGIIAYTIWTNASL